MAEQDYLTAMATAVNAMKIPDLVKMIPTYDGETKKLLPWVASVDTALLPLAVFHASPIYRGWIQAIRNKIIGKAEDALLREGTELSWVAIKATLTTNFGDKRDLSSLTQQIPCLEQSSKTINEFYNECLSLTSEINAVVSLDTENQGHVPAIMRVMKLMIKDSFIDGLKEPYSSYTRNARPDTIQDAKSFALDQETAKSRKLRKFPTNLISKTIPKQTNNYNPRPNFNQNFRTQHQPNTPTPMDVDASTRMRYRPNQNFPQNYRPNQNFPQRFPNSNQNFPQRYPNPNQNQNYQPPARPFYQQGQPQQSQIRNIPRNSFQNAPKWSSEELSNNETYPDPYEEHYNHAENQDEDVENTEQDSETNDIDDLNFSVEPPPNEAI